MKEDLYLIVGEIRGDVKAIKERLDDLPCTSHTQKIEEFDSYKNKAVGMVAIIGIIAGFVGFLLMPIINYFLGRFKL